MFWLFSHNKLNIAATGIHVTLVVSSVGFQEPRRRRELAHQYWRFNTNRMITHHNLSTDQHLSRFQTNFLVSIYTRGGGGRGEEQRVPMPGLKPDPLISPPNLLQRMERKYIVVFTSYTPVPCISYNST